MEALPKHDIGIAKMVTGSFDETLAKTEAALKAQGFGILTRIDVKATLEEKLGVTVGRQVILGACNPPIAHKALEIEPRVGLMLPCNVVVRETKAGVSVEAVEPYVMVEMFPGKSLAAVAAEASDRLHKAIAAI
jgi:uncharacterized protein (DUF302 family)